MNRTVNDYKTYFHEDTQVSVSIKLADNRILELASQVRNLKGDCVTLDIVGAEPIEEREAEPGSEVLISFWTGWSLCRCSAVLMQKLYGRWLFIRLIGPVLEKQSREYFRLDVSIPVCYTIPEKQQLPEVHDEWAATLGLATEDSVPRLVACPEGFKVVSWNGRDEIAPHPVNLSGGGLRFKTPEYVEPESLLSVELFLPLAPPRVIHTVAESLRCSEIMLGREKGNSYITATRFHFISNKDRETIIAFLFSEQRRILNSYPGKRL